jgi:hypothetical protein
MKTADEAYEQWFAGVPPSKFNRRFNSFGAAVAEKRFFLKLARSDFCQFFCQVNCFFVVEVGVGIMQETVTLSFYGLNHTGIIMANVHAGYARVKVNVLVSINVFDYAVVC